MRNREKFNEKQKKQIRHWKKKIKKLTLYKKIEVLDYAAKGYTNAEISKLTGYTIRRISDFLTEYLQNGISLNSQIHNLYIQSKPINSRFMKRCIVVSTTTLFFRLRSV